MENVNGGAANKPYIIETTGSSVAIIDYDNNGWPDILIVNGHVYPQVDVNLLGSTYREPRLLYWDQGNGKFKDIS
jgi:hypothetical protein